jgi:uncharacterized membrane protein HdeD (DUF308 family)
MTVAQPPAITAAQDRPHRAAVALRGVAAIVLGALALWHPGYTTALIVAFAVFAIVDGVIRLVSALRTTRRDRGWWLHGLEGVAGIAIGIVTLRGVHSLITLTWTIAEWSGIVGILSVIFSIAAWRRLPDAWLLLLGGLVLIALAVLLLWETRAGLFSPGLTLGAFAVLYGVVSLVIAVRSPGRSLRSA